MKRLSVLLVAAALPVLVGWYDYGTTVKREEPKYGKVFQGISLRIQTKNSEFEQDTPEEVVVHIKNDTDRTRLTMQEPGEGRRFALYIVVANEDGTSLFSRNLLEKMPDNPIAKERIPPKASCELVRVKFNELEVAKVETYRDGLPYFEPKQKMSNAAWLTPRVYMIKAVLISALPEKRPDFVTASEIWPVLLKPKSGDRMAETEKEALMRKYLAKMSEGAYGGVGVSSQLAALGEDAVGPLIAMAEKTGKGAKDEAAATKVQESRIWAIVTLCNTHSKRAEDYILKRLQDPIDFGDLSFLAWHSQGFHSQRVTKAIRQMAEDVACGREMPWEKTHGAKSRGHGMGSLQFMCKHLISIKQSVTDKTVAAAVNFTNPETTGFVLMAWQPDSGEKAVDTLLPLIRKGNVHPNLRKLVVAMLSRYYAKEGFPAYNRQATPEEQEQAWLQAALWLNRKGKLSNSEMKEFLARFVFGVRKEDDGTKRDVMLALRRFAGKSGYPVTSARPDPVADWVATWRWAIRGTKLPAKETAAFLCQQMRTNEEIPDVVRRGLLIELKQAIGAKFPLKAKTVGEIDLDNDWPTCGQWLVQHRYFGKK
jgi:hypothetical protein